MKIFEKKNKYFIALVLFLVACFPETRGQENEYYLWTGVKLSKEIIPDLKLVINPELRTMFNFEEKELLMETGLGFDPFKFLGLDLLYRLSREYSSDKTITQHRFAFDIQPKAEIDRFSVGLRIRYANYSESEPEAGNIEKYLRYRLETGYDIKESKLEPYCSLELFHNLPEKEIDKLRYLFGISYKFNKIHSIDNFFIFQDYPGKNKNCYIFGVTYKIKLQNPIWQKRI